MTGVGSVTSFETHIKMISSCGKYLQNYMQHLPSSTRALGGIPASMSQRNRCLRTGRHRLEASAGWLAESRLEFHTREQTVQGWGVWGWGCGSSTKGFPDVRCQHFLLRLQHGLLQPRSRLGFALCG